MAHLLSAIRRVIQRRTVILRLAHAQARGHIKVGSDLGGWYIPTHLLNSNAVCYCVGAGEDISFDLELVGRYGCSVFTFDPTPRALKHLNSLREIIKQH